MTDTPKRPDDGQPSELEQRLRMSKRRFVRLFLGSATAYSVPLLASFSMEGLGMGSARAQAQNFPGESGFGFFTANEAGASGRPSEKFQERFPFFSSNQTGRGRSGVPD